MHILSSPPREVLNRSRSPRLRMILSFLLVALGTAYAVRADLAFEGDTELLRLVTAAHRDNAERIRTWRGTARVERETHDTLEVSPDRKSEYALTGDVSFVLDRDQRALRSNWTDLTKRLRPHPTVADPNQPALNVSNVMVKGDGTYRYEGLIKSTGKQLVIWPATKEGAATNVSNRDFNPLGLLNTEDVASLEWAYTMWTGPEEERPAGAGTRVTRVTRSGSIVTVQTHLKAPDREDMDVWEFDLSQGGNIVRMYSEFWGVVEEKEYQFAQEGGVWIPVAMTKNRKDRQKGRYAIERVSFGVNVVNEAVDSSEFALSKLGIRPGMLVTDRRVSGRPIVYEYKDESAFEDVANEIDSAVAELLPPLSDGQQRDGGDAAAMTDVPTTAQPARPSTEGCDTGASARAYYAIGAGGVGLAIMLGLLQRWRTARRGST